MMAIPNALNQDTDQGPVVQRIVNLTSSLVVKMLTVLVDAISNSQVFFAEKNVSSFCKCKSSSHFFSAKILYDIFNDQNFNDSLTNCIVNFQQLGPDCTNAQADINLRRVYIFEGTSSDVGAQLGIHRNYPKFWDTLSMPSQTRHHENMPI